MHHRIFMYFDNSWIHESMKIVPPSTCQVLLGSEIDQSFKIPDKVEIDLKES